MSSALRIGIVGCGKIADSHAAQIQRLGGCELVAVCDAEPLRAEQLGERFSVEGRFTELSAFLEVAKPDVVHVTTPPQSHLAIALEHPIHINKAASALIDAVFRSEKSGGWEKV